MIWAAAFFGGCLLFYGGYLLVNAYWWGKSEDGKFNEEERFANGDLPKVSVLVAARNEAANIETVVRAVMSQTYPKDKLECIVIDDHSEDETAIKVEALIKEYPQVKLLRRAGKIRNAYKKAAISQGIKEARGEIILTTDADCSMGPQWVASMVAPFSEGTQGSKMEDGMALNNGKGRRGDGQGGDSGRIGLVSGPVVLASEKKIFQEFQVLEFMGLIAVGAASIQAGRPNMCNGANLAYRKSAFEAVGGFGGVDDIASGDDEFLMHKIHASGMGVKFAREKAVIVETDALKTWQDFRNQRLRWVSKSTAYKRKSITLTLVLSYLAMLIFPLLTVFSFFDARYALILAAAFSFKCLCEFMILFPAARFFDKLHLLKWLIPEQFLHIAYVLWVGIAANVGGYTWKGRKVS